MEVLGAGPRPDGVAPLRIKKSDYLPKQFVYILEVHQVFALLHQVLHMHNCILCVQSRGVTPKTMVATCVQAIVKKITEDVANAQVKHRNLNGL